MHVIMHTGIHKAIASYLQSFLPMNLNLNLTYYGSLHIKTMHACISESYTQKIHIFIAIRIATYLVK